MIQREVAEAKVTFRQVVIPDGHGGHTARYVLEVRGTQLNIQAVKAYLATGEHC